MLGRVASPREKNTGININVAKDLTTKAKYKEKKLELQRSAVAIAMKSRLAIPAAKVATKILIEEQPDWEVSDQRVSVAGRLHVFDSRNDSTMPTVEGVVREDSVDPDGLELGTLQRGRGRRRGCGRRRKAASEKAVGGGDSSKRLGNSEWTWSSPGRPTVVTTKSGSTRRVYSFYEGSTSTSLESPEPKKTENSATNKAHFDLTVPRDITNDLSSQSNHGVTNTKRTKQRTGHSYRKRPAQTDRLVCQEKVMRVEVPQRAMEVQIIGPMSVENEGEKQPESLTQEQTVHGSMSVEPAPEILARNMPLKLYSNRKRTLSKETQDIMDGGTPDLELELPSTLEQMRWIEQAAAALKKEKAVPTPTEKLLMKQREPTLESLGEPTEKNQPVDDTVVSMPVAETMKRSVDNPLPNEKLTISSAIGAESASVDSIASSSDAKSPRREQQVAELVKSSKTDMKFWFKEEDAVEPRKSGATNDTLMTEDTRTKQPLPDRGEVASDSLFSNATVNPNTTASGVVSNDIQTINTPMKTRGPDAHVGQSYRTAEKDGAEDQFLWQEMLKTFKTGGQTLASKNQETSVSTEEGNEVQPATEELRSDTVVEASDVETTSVAGQPAERRLPLRNEGETVSTEADREQSDEEEETRLESKEKTKMISEQVGCLTEGNVEVRVATDEPDDTLAEVEMRSGTEDTAGAMTEEVGGSHMHNKQRETLTEIDVRSEIEEQARPITKGVDSQSETTNATEKVSDGCALDEQVETTEIDDNISDTSSDVDAWSGTEETVDAQEGGTTNGIEGHGDVVNDEALRTLETQVGTGATGERTVGEEQAEQTGGTTDGKLAVADGTDELAGFEDAVEEQTVFVIEDAGRARETQSGATDVTDDSNVTEEQAGVVSEEVGGTVKQEVETTEITDERADTGTEDGTEGPVDVVGDDVDHIMEGQVETTYKTDESTVGGEQAEQTGETTHDQLETAEGMDELADFEDAAEEQTGFVIDDDGITMEKHIDAADVTNDGNAHEEQAEVVSGEIGGTLEPHLEATEGTDELADAGVEDGAEGGAEVGVVSEEVDRTEERQLETAGGTDRASQDETVNQLVETADVIDYLSDSGSEDNADIVGAEFDHSPPSDVTDGSDVKDEQTEAVAESVDAKKDGQVKTADETDELIAGSGDGEEEPVDEVNETAVNSMESQVEKADLMVEQTVAQGKAEARMEGTMDRQVDTTDRNHHQADAQNEAGIEEQAEIVTGEVDRTLERQVEITDAVYKSTKAPEGQTEQINYRIGNEQAETADDVPSMALGVAALAALESERITDDAVIERVAPAVHAETCVESSHFDHVDPTEDRPEEHIDTEKPAVTSTMEQLAHVPKDMMTAASGGVAENAKVAGAELKNGKDSSSSQVIEEDSVSFVSATNYIDEASAASEDWIAFDKQRSDDNVTKTDEHQEGTGSTEGDFGVVAATEQDEKFAWNHDGNFESIDAPTLERSIISAGQETVRNANDDSVSNKKKQQDPASNRDVWVLDASHTARETNSSSTQGLRDDSAPQNTEDLGNPGSVKRNTGGDCGTQDDDITKTAVLVVDESSTAGVPLDHPQLDETRAKDEDPSDLFRKTEVYEHERGLKPLEWVAVVKDFETCDHQDTIREESQEDFERVEGGVQVVDLQSDGVEHLGENRHTQTEESKADDNDDGIGVDAVEIEVVIDEEYDEGSVVVVSETEIGVEAGVNGGDVEAKRKVENKDETNQTGLSTVVVAPNEEQIDVEEIQRARDEGKGKDQASVEHTEDEIAENVVGSEDNGEDQVLKDEEAVDEHEEDGNEEEIGVTLESGVNVGEKRSNLAAIAADFATVGMLLAATEGNVWILETHDDDDSTKDDIDEGDNTTDADLDDDSNFDYSSEEGDDDNEAAGGRATGAEKEDADDEEEDSNFDSSEEGEDDSDVEVRQTSGLDDKSLEVSKDGDNTFEFGGLTGLAYEGPSKAQKMTATELGALGPFLAGTTQELPTLEEENSPEVTTSRKSSSTREPSSAVETSTVLSGDGALNISNESTEENEDSVPDLDLKMRKHQVLEVCASASTELDDSGDEHDPQTVVYDDGAACAATKQFDRSHIYYDDNDCMKQEGLCEGCSIL